MRMSARLSLPVCLLLALAPPVPAAAAEFVLKVAGEGGGAFACGYRLTIEDGQTFAGELAGGAPQTYRFEGRALSIVLRPVGEGGELKAELRLDGRIVAHGLASSGGVISLSVAASR